MHACMCACKRASGPGVHVSGLHACIHARVLMHAAPSSACKRACMHACTRMLAFSCAGLPTAPNTPHRTIVSELSQLQRADGSAKWAQENTCVLAAVYGPRLAPPRKEDAERAVVEVVFKPRSGIQGERRTREAQPPLAVWCLAWASMGLDDLEGVAHGCAAGSQRTGWASLGAIHSAHEESCGPVLRTRPQEALCRSSSSQEDEPPPAPPRAEH